MKLKLEEAPKKTLELELLDGSEVKLTLKNITIKDQLALEKKTDGVTKVSEVIEILDALVENLDPGFVEGLTMDELIQVMKAINKLRSDEALEEDTEEKKPESEAATTS